MKTTCGTKFGAGLLMVGLMIALPAMAQMGGGMMDGRKGDGPGMQQMSGMMHDMADQMMGMSGDMGKGGMGAAQQKQMGERMRTMATMMDQMSGMMGKGMMMDTGMQRQMDDMRKQMDAMMKQAPTGKNK
jgi:hypothetical protein